MGAIEKVALSSGEIVPIEVPEGTQDVGAFIGKALMSIESQQSPPSQMGQPSIGQSPMGQSQIGQSPMGQQALPQQDVQPVTPPEVVPEFYGEEDVPTELDYPTLPSKKNVDAAARGVLWDRPATSGHAVSSFAYSPEDRLNAYKKATKSEVRMSDDGEVEYKTKDGKWALAAPGDDVGVAVSSNAAMGLIVPEILVSGLVASITRNPTVTVAAESLTAGIMEIARLYTGKFAFGINDDMTANQAIAEGLKTAGLAGVSGVATNVITRVGQYLYRRLSGEFIPTKVAEQLTVEGVASDDMIDLAEEINSRIKGAELRLTVAQQAESEELLGTMERVKKNKSTRRLYGKVQDEQMQALFEFYDVISGPGSRQSIPETGQAVMDRVVSQSQDEITGLERLIGRKESELTQVLNDIKSQPGEDLGPDIRDFASDQIDIFEGKARQGAEAIHTLAGGRAFIPNNNTYATLTELSEQNRLFLLEGMETPVAKMTPGGATDAADAERLQAFGNVDYTESPSITSKVMDKNAKFTMKEAWTTLSRLKELQRKGNVALAAQGIDDSHISKLISSLEKDLMESGGGDPLLSGKYSEFTKWYKSEKTRLQRNQVGRLFSKKDGPHGDYTVNDEAVFDSFFPPRALKPAKNLKALVQNDYEMMEAVRQGVADHYKRNVVVKGRVDMDAHEKWVAEHGKQAELFFPKGQRELLSKPRGVETLIRAKESAVKALRDRFNDSTGAELMNMNAGSIGKALLSESDPGKARWLMRELRAVDKNGNQKFPDLERQVKAAVVSTLKAKLTGKREGGPFGNTEKFSVNKLSDILDADKGYREILSEVMGDQYVSDLGTLLKALRVVKATAREENTSNTAETLAVLGRAYFGVLTKPGRAVTAAKFMFGKMADNLLFEALISPDNLRVLVDKRNKDIRSRQVASLFNAVGAGALADFHSIQE